MTLIMSILNVSVLILLAGLVWAIIRVHNPRLSYIEQRLRAITALLEQLPMESRLTEHLSAHEQQLRSIGEQLLSHPDAGLLHRYLQDQTDQLLAIISTHESGDKPGVTRADLEQALRQTNARLERVLWSLRFDEEKYLENTHDKHDQPGGPGTTNETAPGKKDKAGRESRDDTMLMKSLDGGSDSYQAMLDYMRTTGKSGTDALHALEMARVMTSR